MKLILVIVFSLLFAYCIAAHFFHIKEIPISDARHILNQKLCALYEKTCPSPTVNIFFCAQEWQELGVLLSKYFNTTLHLQNFGDNQDGTISVTYNAGGILPKYQDFHKTLIQCIACDTQNFFVEKIGCKVPIHVQTLTDNFLHLRFAYNTKGKQAFDAINTACEQLEVSRQTPTHHRVLFHPRENTSTNIVIGWLLEEWYTNHILFQIGTDLKKHCHILITGRTGSGKSYMLRLILCQLMYKPKKYEIWLADFKGSNDFKFLHEHEVHYASGNIDEVIALIEDFYELFLSAKNGELFPARNQVLVLDEYPGLQTYLASTDKKTGEHIKQIICELLMLGRDVNGISFNVILTAQRPDANLLFPHGSRDSFHIHVALGNLSAEAKGMITDSPSSLPDRIYQRGVGIVSIDGQGISEIFIPEIVGLDAAIQAAPTRRLP